MKTKFAEIVLALALSTMLVMPSYARGGGFGGGGGGFRGGGGGFRGSEGGFRGGDNNRNAGFGGHSENRNYGQGFSSISGGRPEMSGGGFNNARGFENRPGFNNASGLENRGGFENKNGFGPISGQPVHPTTMPTDGGMGKIAGIQNRHPDQPITRPINQNNLHNQGQNIRNSFNHDQFNNQHNQVNQYNYNRYGGSNHYGAYGGYGHYGYGGWANHGWWGYPGGWCAPGWGMTTAYMATTFGTMAAFLGLAALSGNRSSGSSNTTVVTAPQPVTYDYGSNVTYQGDTVYVNGQPAGSDQDYYQQAQQLAAAAYAPPSQQPEQQPDQQAQSPSDQTQWKPLGVFALAEAGQNQSTMLFQLAINQQGIVRGNYFNQITNESSEIYGSLDKKTQRVSWSVGTNPNTVFDTSLGNLMKEDSSILVHFGANNTQQMAFIRMPPPPANSSPAAPQTPSTS